LQAQSYFTVSPQCMHFTAWALMISKQDGHSFR